jgi:hypothetical protein
MKRLITILTILSIAVTGNSQIMQSLLIGDGYICDVTHTISGDDIECPGDGTIITANPTGGGGTYQYSWVGGPFQSSSTLNLNIAGTNFQSQVRDAADTDCEGPVVLFDVGYEFSILDGATTLMQGDTVYIGSVTEGGSAFEYNLQVDNETGSNINPVLGDFTFGNADFSIAGYNATWDGTPNLTDITVRFDPTGLATDDYFSTFVIDATGIGCETDGEYNLVLKATVESAVVADVVVPDISITPLDNITPSGTNNIGLTVSGDYAHLTDVSANTYSIIDISDPSNMVTRDAEVNGGGIDLLGARWTHIKGDTAFVSASSSDEITIFDFSTPTNITRLGEFGNSNINDLVYYIGSRNDTIFTVAYDGNNSNSGILSSWDISGTPTLIDSWAASSGDAFRNGRVGEIIGNYFFVGGDADAGSGGAGQVAMIDITNGNFDQTYEDVYDFASGGYRPFHSKRYGDYMYVGDISKDYVHVFDISDPTDITLVDQLVDNIDANIRDPWSVAVGYNHLFVSSFADDRIAIFDIDTVTNPIPFNSYILDNSGTIELDGPRQPIQQDGVLYVTSTANDRFQSLQIFDSIPYPESATISPEWPTEILAGTQRMNAFYEGPIVKVRRSSDNAEQNFQQWEINNGDLVTWVGAGYDGFVTRAYDQSGQENDLTQTVASLQPKIVNNGTLVTSGGTASMLFDGVDDHFDMPDVFGGKSEISAVAVIEFTSVTGCYLVGSTDNGDDFTDGVFNWELDPTTSESMRSGYIQTTGNTVTSAGVEDLTTGTQYTVFTEFIINDEVNIWTGANIEDTETPGNFALQTLAGSEAFALGGTGQASTSNTFDGYISAFAVFPKRKTSTHRVIYDKLKTIY